ncbi:LysR family transcriptional regulator [Bradyrhizobium jicamae]|uniref:LysR family transcriptional regulator n=1 Tax=Bradyrhizobium jicamae TaxID=280332 RepID=A0ABS5FDR3_9BRAD|nr:LysR family transcriptional regulator [Bradyrhizobium jicamae]MBR0794920.1 LysR family transcriptional regulator [Bradyrhizobium jicamae]
MPDRPILGLQDMEAFVAVAESASFTRAAQRLGTGKSNAGKAVQRLEAHLGTRLFQRTTRAVRLTEDGETYLKAARAALEGLSDAENALAARRTEPAGRVRIDMPSAFGRLFLPALEDVRRSHPKVTLDISLSDKHSDAIAEGWDLVIRIGQLPEQGEMMVRKLCTLRNGLYASPQYLERRGMPTSIEDLENRDAIVFRQAAGTIRPWTLDDGSRQFDFLPPTFAVIVSDGQALVDATVEGFGIAQICNQSAQPHLRAQRLVRVLPEADVEGFPVHALVPSGRDMPKKTRLVLDTLAHLMKQATS